MQNQQLRFQVGDIVRLVSGFNNLENTGISTQDVSGLFVVWSVGHGPYGAPEYQIDTYPVKRARWWANDDWLVRDEFMTALHRAKEEHAKKIQAG